MSQTDSLEEHLLHPPLDSQQRELVALQLNLPDAVLEAALSELEQNTPLSARIGLRLLRSLSNESDGWKARPQSRLLLLAFQSLLSAEVERPDTRALQRALQQTYPELFRQDH
jgi:hypothetical protein